MHGCESWTTKKAEHWRIYAFELWCWRRLASPLDCKEIQPVHPKGDQSWVFIGRNDAEAETPLLWPPHAKSWLIGKDPDAGRDGGQEEKGTTKDEMAGWHHQLNGYEFEWTPGVGNGQGVLACCDSWGCKESDTTEWVNWNECLLKAGEEGDNRGWDGWMASPTWWTWLWASSDSWWWTGMPGVLQSMGSQNQMQMSNWTELNVFLVL